MNEPRETMQCDQCQAEVVLQDATFFEGPGSTWWCSCTSCGVILEPPKSAE
jgi:hypothetical protein